MIRFCATPQTGIPDTSTVSDEPFLPLRAPSSKRIREKSLASGRERAFPIAGGDKWKREAEEVGAGAIMNECVERLAYL
jgi:hypothetical protein